MQNYYDEMSAAFNLSDRDMGSLFTISVNDLCVSFQDARNGKWWRPMSFFLFVKAFLKSYCLGMEWHVEENTQEDQLLHKQGNVQMSRVHAN